MANCSSTELSGTPDRERSGARAQKLELVRIRDLLVEMTQLCAECVRYLAGLIVVALRGRGIFVEGPISVPAAAATSEA